MSRRVTQPKWDVPVEVAGSSDVDERLRAGAGRTGLLQVLIDHDTPTPGRCPRCGWVATSSRRDCPSRVIAKALLERKPLPTWLAHVVDDVPAARVKTTPEIFMPLLRRSRVDETGGASPADVVRSWCGLSPSLRLTLEPVPVGYSGLLPLRARVSDS